jgi:IclR family acetate operon transcriptional repressor
VLDALADAGELGTNEVARRTGMNASTASRQLATLAAARLVEHLPESGRYRLGPRLVELGYLAVARLGLRELARPHLRALVDETGETATLSVPGGGDAITVDFVQSPASVQSIARLGRPSIGHATAAGKIVLAFGGVPLPPGPLERYTDRTILDPGRLAEELARVRALGVAEAVEEREPALCAVAAPVFADDGELVGVLGVQGPAERFGRSPRSRAAALLTARAQALSRALGSGRPA